MKIKHIAIATLSTASLLLGNAAMASDSSTPPTPGPKDLTWSQFENLDRKSTRLNSSH